MSELLRNPDLAAAARSLETGARASLLIPGAAANKKATLSGGFFGSSSDGSNHGSVTAGAI